ncbi:alpha/beta hydrolase fold domain-containing protein [Faecalicatena contorta]|nr:alpha/beta hydrolase fold domain-containing protein [Faecalicatena contorta]
MPVEDCYCAYQWTIKNASKLGIDKNRIVIGGDSAGGNLLIKNRILFFRENSIFRKPLFELQAVFEGFAHSFVYQIIAMCIWVKCNGID